MQAQLGINLGIHPLILDNWFILVRVVVDLEPVLGSKKEIHPVWNTSQLKEKKPIWMSKNMGNSSQTIT